MTILTWKQTKNLEIKFQLNWLSHPRLDASGYVELHLLITLLLLLLLVACCCCFFFLLSRCLYSFNINCCYNELIKGNLQKLWDKVLYYLFTCKAAFEIIGLNLKISVIWQNINMIKQDNPNIKYTELKDQSMVDFHGLLGLIGMEEINVSFKQL